MNNDLSEVMKNLFSNSDDVPSDFGSLVSAIERHGFPLSMRQMRAISYAKTLCPESETLHNLHKDLLQASTHCVNPDLFLKATSEWNMTRFFTGKIPLNRMQGMGGQER